MYRQPASPARAACSIENNVVASVLMPVASNVRHACRPSQVLGIFMHTLDTSKTGFTYWNRRMIPIIANQMSSAISMEGLLTPSISNLHFCGVCVQRVTLNMDKASNIRRYLLRQAHNLSLSMSAGFWRSQLLTYSDLDGKLLQSNFSKLFQPCARQSDRPGK